MTANSIYTPEEKPKIVLEGMNGTTSISDRCRNDGLKPARFYSWKYHVLKSAIEIFKTRNGKLDKDRIRIEHDKKIARLKATIADVVSENLEIKKKIGERLQRRERI